ncbi:MAG: DUF3987 domain-containing protein [bacterium]|nr:DUF3987 domain-containing protein [bacterium]
MGGKTGYYETRLGKIKWTGNQGKALCPFHEDTVPSLSINSSTGAFKCFACGEQGSFKLFKERIGDAPLPALPPTKARKKNHGKISVAYDYTDADANLLYQNVRFEPKDFRIRRPDGKGGWVWNLDGQARVPFGLPELNRAVSVAIVEGEKDVRTLGTWGITATTFGSAGTWNADYNDVFLGKRVAILPDNDRAGLEHAQRVARQLHGVAESLKIVILPVGAGEDVTDYLEKHGEIADLINLIKATSEFEVPADQPEELVEIEAPLPLRPSRPEPEPYPVDSLPALLRDLVSDIVASVQCPAALAANTVVAAATFAVQGHVQVNIDGRSFPVSNNFITIGDSGERKDAVDRIAWGPVYRRQKTLHDLRSLRLVEYEAAVAGWEKEKIMRMKKSNSGSAVKAALVELGAKPEPPIGATLILEEPTFEALVKTLHTEQPSIGLSTTEGGRLVGGHAFNRDNLLKTISGFSNCWDGKPLTRNRSGDGNLLLHGRRVTVNLMMQPVVWAEMTGNVLFRQQGFFSRCLIAWPASNIGNRPYRAVNVLELPSFKRFFQVMMGLLERPLPLAEGARNELTPRSLTLTPDAKSVWIKFHDHIEQLLAEGQALYPIRGFAAKAAEHVLRLAGVFAVIEDPDAAEITVTGLEQAIPTVQFHLGEAVRLQQNAEEEPELAGAAKVLEWIRQRGGKVSLPTLYAYGPPVARPKNNALAIMEVLVDHRLARVTHGDARTPRAWELVET